VSPSSDELLPPEQFRLYGISTRFPQKLSEQVELKRLQEGVYEVVWGVHPIRVLVLSEMPEEEQNAIWNLFSGVREKVVSGAAQYRHHVWEMSTLLNQLFESYQLEGIAMPYTWEDFRRDYTREHVDLLTPEERLRGLSAEEVLRRFSAEEVLRRFSVGERLQGLSAEEIKAYLEKLEKPRKRRKQ
jgi:hypothetical protein